MLRATRARFPGAASLMILAAPAPAAAEMAAAPATKPALTIGIVDFAEIPGLAPPPPRAPREPAWRTTFGSERTSEPTVKINSESLAPLADVDAVLIQGVKADARLRRLFPPRTWRLIVSRRLLSPTDPVGFRTVRSDMPPTTAIAVKARSDLRITARALSLSLDKPGIERSASDPESAATAVRLIDPIGRTLWLVSLALPASCGAGGGICPARTTLEAWRRERLASDEPTLVGGRVMREASAHVSTDDDRPPGASCIYTVESDIPWTDSPTRKNPSDSPEGCISVIQLGG
ncbi:hypothetical protein [Hyphomicrobium sp. CS1GBMeth3]|uniref:hypothetical protein n=1 Tax=Hyphomicrobium sp. CS1GBMeth3 TaxID=1892845 RepID=UPI0009316721|nr:hypothetical protein [Hyphomicrobium sp. CS1GBMeth3]